MSMVDRKDVHRDGQPCVPHGVEPDRQERGRTPPAGLGGDPKMVVEQALHGPLVRGEIPADLDAGIRGRPLRAPAREDDP